MRFPKVPVPCRILLAVLLLWACGMANAQPTTPSFRYVSSNPSGACTNGVPNQYNFTNNQEWGCTNSVWTLVNSGGGGGGGTVTSVTGPSIFTWATATTTPTATINSQSQNVFLASPNGSSGTPTFRAIVAADLPASCVPSSTANKVLVDNGSGGCTDSAVTVDPTAGLAGGISLPQGNPKTPPTNNVTIQAPVAVTAYSHVLPGAAATGIPHYTNAANVITETISPVANADLANPSTTVNGQTCTLGSTCTVSGGGGTAGSTLFSTTNSTTVTATSATTLIGTVTGSTTIPANTFAAGQVFHVMAQGYYTTPATPASLTITLNIGGTIRLTTGAVVQLASVTNGVWNVNCDVTTRTSGSSGTQIANCIFVGTGATLTPGEAPMQTSSTWTIDTTATQAIDIQATWSTATGSPAITSTNLAAWIPGAPTAIPAGLYLISSQTLSSPAASVTISSIPATYNNLKLVINGACSAAAVEQNVLMQFNSDSASHYATQIVYGAGAAAAAFATNAINSPGTSIAVGNVDCSSITNGAGSITVDIPNYAGTVFSKKGAGTFIASSTTTNLAAVTVGFLWSQTSAISSINLTVNGGSNFITGSAFYLYGF